MCYSWFLKIHDFFFGGRLFGGEGDDQRRCWVPLQGNNFISYLPSIFRNNIEFCFELLADVTRFSTLIAHKIGFCYLGSMLV